jgi:cytoskeletal protein RodZ
MTPDNKPEWFKLAETDNSASTRKISKGLPIMALVAVAAIIGVGTIFAQPQEQTPASATETVAPAVVDSNQTSTQSESVPQINNDAPVGATTATTPAAPKTPASSGVANPLAKKPMGGGDDDEDEGDDDEDEGDDD